MTIDVTKNVDLLRYYFSYLSLEDISACSQVNNTWKQATNGSKCVEIAKQIFNFKFLEISNYALFLHKLTPQILNSNEEILRRINSFLFKVHLGTNGRFRCSINPNTPLISVEVKGSEERIPRPPPLPPTYAGRYENSVTNYQYEEYFIAPNGIGKGSCETPSPPKYKGKYHHPVKLDLDSDIECITAFRPRINDHIQAIFRFPKLFNSSTQLERRIKFIVLKRCEQLSRQLLAQESMMLHPDLEVSVCGTELLYG